MSQRIPAKITLDAYAASHRAIAELKATGELTEAASPDAGIQELPDRGGGDRWYRAGREDQEGTVQSRQAQWPRGNATSKVNVWARRLYGNYSSNTQRPPVFLASRRMTFDAIKLRLGR